MVIARIAVIVFMIMLVISLIFFTEDFLKYIESNNASNQLIEDIITKENDEIKIDWKRLESINADVVGWIRIEDTNINYPILKDNHNLKYLKHSFNGEHNKNGSIFTLNNSPFEEELTVIYGHNMRNGIMFSELSKYMNEEFLNTHYTFEIYTKNQNYKATIFSCYSIAEDVEEANIKSLDFKDEIEYYKKISKYTINNIGKIEKIIKLSTCSYINSQYSPTEQRYYIVAKLERI